MEVSMETQSHNTFAEVIVAALLEQKMQPLDAYFLLALNHCPLLSIAGYVPGQKTVKSLPLN